MSTLTVEIAESSLDALKELAELERLAPSELLEKAIAAYAKANVIRRPVETLEADTAFQAAFGLWADHEEDGLAYQERMRAEWPD